ncbi:MAG: hypothetical protein FWG20_07425, partial [Candidatus Cloacimonetes bacterium]|nr:hypothetical protein [Candidatus Cloacimonadota bacterium]
WASTLDQPDVDIVLENIKQNEIHLLESHVFQFDFLNDDFEKLPPKLLKIIQETPEKLIIYINPPYAEAATAKREGNKFGVSESKVKNRYKHLIGNAINEIFTQFLARIYMEIPNSKIAEFSKQKALVGPNFTNFRKFFITKFKKGFIVPANTFDNVKGNFPIGFKIWDTYQGSHLKSAKFDIYNKFGIWIGQKNYHDGPDVRYINSWYNKFYDKDGIEIAVLNTRGNDFQNQNYIYLSTENNNNHTNIVTIDNLIPTVIYISVRKVIPASWLNDRDQLLYPNDKWYKDNEFQTNCLTYVLFNNSNNISCKYGTNHWIPFNEREVDAKDSFESNFMTNFLTSPNLSYHVQLTNGKLVNITQKDPLIFSEQAQAVFSTGRELWKYYHAQPFGAGDYNVNASFYDIREYFQGRDDKGKMNNTSQDLKYNELLQKLRLELKLLSNQIEPKIYEYGFLKE